MNNTPLSTTFMIFNIEQCQGGCRTKSEARGPRMLRPWSLTSQSRSSQSWEASKPMLFLDSRSRFSMRFHLSSPSSRINSSKLCLHAAPTPMRTTSKLYILQHTGLSFVSSRISFLTACPHNGRESCLKSVSAPRASARSAPHCSAGPLHPKACITTFRRDDHLWPVCLARWPQP